LSKTALIRARCCELLARQCELPKPESFFTVGLFSTLDAMMDQPLEELLKELPLSEEAKTALIEHKGIFGEALNCTLAMEKSDFSFIGFANLQVTQLSDIYLDAINWAEEITNVI
jgi:EAL and modified HD-GYP domain-containing signal transduction protein